MSCLNKLNFQVVNFTTSANKEVEHIRYYSKNYNTGMFLLGSASTLLHLDPKQFTHFFVKVTDLIVCLNKTK